MWGGKKLEQNWISVQIFSMYVSFNRVKCLQGLDLSCGPLGEYPVNVPSSMAMEADAMGFPEKTTKPL